MVEESSLEVGFVRDGEDADGFWELLRERDRVPLGGVRGIMGGRRGEGEGARSPHAVGVLGGEGVGLDTEVAKHGVRAPSSKELDGVGVDASTEEGRSPTWSERPGRDQGGVDAGHVLDLQGGMTEGVGDEARRHIIPVAVGRADMMVERCLRGGVVSLEVKSKASGGLAGAEERIFGGGVTDFLASYAVLLVGELKGRVSDPEDSLVIQRRGRGGVDLAIDVEVDIHEAEGLGATVFQGVGVFSGSEEPEEGKDAEVDDMGVGLSPLGVFSVKGITEGDEDGGVDRVGATGRGIFVAEALEERRE